MNQPSTTCGSGGACWRSRPLPCAARSWTDPLTELLNRRAFDQNLDHAVRQWERHRRAFVLVLGDVDHFKLINDRFGHPVGDEVLRQLAIRIRSALRN